MADLPEALDAALSDHYSVRADFKSPVESTRGLKARMRALEKAHGSKKAAAEAAGVPPNTWYRWGTGKQKPGADSLGKVGAAHLALIRAAKVASKGAPSSIAIEATVACVPVGPTRKDDSKARYYNGGQASATAAHRWFKADKLTGPQLRDIVGTWAAGKSPQAVADVLLDEIQRAYGSRFEFEGNDVNIEIS